MHEAVIVEYHILLVIVNVIVTFEGGCCQTNLLLLSIGVVSLHHADIKMYR